MSLARLYLQLGYSATTNDGLNLPQFSSHATRRLPRIARFQNRGHDRDAGRAGREYRRDLVRTDPADGDDRDVDGLDDPSQLVQPARRLAGMRGRGENVAEGQPIGSLGRGLGCARHAVDRRAKREASPRLVSSWASPPPSTISWTLC